MLGLWRLSDTDGVGTRHGFLLAVLEFPFHRILGLLVFRFMLHVRVAAALFSFRWTRAISFSLRWVRWDNGVAVAWFSAGRELKRCPDAASRG